MSLPDFDEWHHKTYGAYFEDIHMRDCDTIEHSMRALVYEIRRYVSETVNFVGKGNSHGTKSDN